MRVYLDNCCYNRPFDGQGDVRILLESIAKLDIQQQMRDGTLEYVWSSILDFEIDKSKFVVRSRQIRPWKAGAVVDICVDGEIRSRAKDFEAAGIKPADALHLACAEAAQCDWFFTVDRGILRKAKPLVSMRVANPMEFFAGD